MRPVRTDTSRATPEKSSLDLVLVHSATDDGGGVNVIRKRGDRLEAAQMRPIEEGRPLQGELVQLTPVAEVPNVYRSETLFDPKEAEAGTARAGSGPPQVATDRYRKNWDAIWRRRRSSALN